MSVATSGRQYSALDITTREFWSRPFAIRDEVFAQLRAAAGLTWHPPLPSLFPMEEAGFWALTRRADIVYVSQHPELFTSTRGVALDPMPAEVQRIATFFLTMDPPEHTVYRRLISAAFTPRNIRRISSVSCSPACGESSSVNPRIYKAISSTESSTCRGSSGKAAAPALV